MHAWPDPPRVEQTSECSCWAAALECWLKATPFGDNVFKSPTNPDGIRRGSLTQNDLISAFGRVDTRNAFTCNGALDQKMQQTFAQVMAPLVGMVMEVVKTPYLLSSWVESRVHNGPVYLIYQVQGAKFAHVVVIYGYFTDENTGNLILKVMNPASDSKGGGLVKGPITNFDNCKIQAGYPKSSFLTWFPGAP
jgi:hypothetical protein